MSDKALASSGCWRGIGRLNNREIEDLNDPDPDGYPDRERE